MLYFFHGQEEYLIELELQKLKSKIVDKSFLSTNYRVYEIRIAAQFGFNITNTPF